MKKNERNRYFQYSFHDSFDSMVILKKMSVCVREKERDKDSHVDDDDDTHTYTLKDGQNFFH